MAQKLYTFSRSIACFFFLFAILGLSANVGNTVISEESKVEIQPEELAFLVSPHDLHLNKDHITVRVNGIDYPIRTLKKYGDRWLARISNGAKDYCPAGHLTCKGCGQCHTEKCWYFVRHCKLWDSDS